TARGDIHLDPGEPGGKPGQARLTLTEFTLGKQPVGTWPFSCDGSGGIQAAEVAGAGVSAGNRDRGSAGGGPDALASAGAPCGIDEPQLQIVEHFLEEMALLVGPIAVGLNP